MKAKYTKVRLLKEFSKVAMGASIYHVVRGGGIHEMTMNDHEGEGVRVSEMTTRSGGLKFFFSDQKMVA